MDIEKDKDLRQPKLLRTDSEQRNRNQYCRFHKEVGHDTDDYRQLIDETKFLIRRGKLKRFTNGERNNGRKDYYDKRRDQDDRGKNTHPRALVIKMIFGGPTVAGVSRNSRNAYAREVMHIVGEAP